GTNGWRQCENRRAGQGEPGTADTPRRQGFRAGAAGQSSGASAPAGCRAGTQARAGAGIIASKGSAAHSIATRAALARQRWAGRRIDERVHRLTVDHDGRVGDRRRTVMLERRRAERAQAVDQGEHPLARLEEVHVVVLAKRLCRVETADAGQIELWRMTG